MRSLILTAALLAALTAGCGNETEPASPAPQKTETASALPAPLPTIDAASAALSDRASAAYSEGRLEDAVSLASEALAKDEGNYKALSTRGIARAFLGAPDGGAEDIRRALALAPSYTQAFYDLAIAEKLGGHYDDSIDHFRKVLEKDPGNVWSLYGIATNYADKRDKAQALSYLSRAAALDPNAVIPEAASQDHFAWLRGDPDFEALLQQK